MPDIRLEVRSQLDEDLLGELLAFVDATADQLGYDALGEHKHAQLRVGASDWTGVLAYEDDVLAGYAHLRWNAPDAVPRVVVEIVTHPAGPPAAERLVRTAEDRLARSGGGQLWLWLHRVDDPDATVAARLGYRIQRELAYMTRTLATRPAVPPLPDGVEVRPYEEGRDDAAFLAVNNSAFEGHPENGGWDAETFAGRRAHPWFDPKGLLMAWRGGELVGFHWTKVEPGAEGPAAEPVGEVYVLAVHPDAQGTGLGRALLEAGLAHVYDEGCRQAVLYVDRADVAAVRLYESSGFSLVHREVCYERDVAPEPGPGAGSAGAC